jgi:hypothetical protein
MKIFFKQFPKRNLILSALILLGLASCKKQNSMGFTPGSGAPTITSVHTYSKTLTTYDSIPLTTYDAAGNVTTKYVTTPLQVVPFDSVTVTGNKGEYYIIYGTNLGSAISVSFNGVAVYFNRALISDQSIIAQIPLNVPTSGPAATDTLSIVTLHGTANYSFTVLAPPPTISSVSDFNFWSGSQITLMGVGFSSVTGVGLSGTTETCTIVSQTDDQLVLQFPSTDAIKANLVISYLSGGDTRTVTPATDFYDLDNAYTIFYKDDFQNTWFDNSWSHPSGTSTEASHSGTASIRANYPAGGWQIEGWAGWNSPTGGIPYDADYKYLTFWVKGGTATHTLVLVGEKMVGGYGQVQNANAYPAQLVTVPAGVWTYFKIPLAPPSSTAGGLLNFWATGSTAQQLGFFLQGMDGDVDEVMYFDEVAFLK